MIRLEVGEWRATLLPAMGGSVSSLDWRGAPVFRPTPEGAQDILQTACFPLVPYANRIADARFTFEGRPVELEVLDRFAPHALHGDGWLSPWTVETEATDRVEMTLNWPGSASGEARGWPWPWRARQVFTLTDQGLEIMLSVTNTGEAAMPAGLGLHPYFHKAADARLILSATGVWLTDETQIPVRLEEPEKVADLSAGLNLAEAPFIDHAYAGWTGVATLEGDGRRVVLRGCHRTRWAQVYSPADADFFCVEPVTHRPDALNATGEEQSGVVRLAPGEELAIIMSVSIDEISSQRP